LPQPFPLQEKRIAGNLMRQRKNEHRMEQTTARWMGHPRRTEGKVVVRGLNKPKPQQRGQSKTFPKTLIEKKTGFRQNCLIESGSGSKGAENWTGPTGGSTFTKIS